MSRDEKSDEAVVPENQANKGADDSSRSLSIWCLEDKFVQQSVTTVLSAALRNIFWDFPTDCVNAEANTTHLMR